MSWGMLQYWFKYSDTLYVHWAHAVFKFPQIEENSQISHNYIHVSAHQKLTSMCDSCSWNVLFFLHLISLFKLVITEIPQTNCMSGPETFEQPWRCRMLIACPLIQLQMVLPLNTKVPQQETRTEGGFHALRCQSFRVTVTPSGHMERYRKRHLFIRAADTEISE